MEDPKFWIIIGIALVSIGSTIAYLLFMFFLPEWVGITGKVARKVEESHQEGTTIEDDFIAKLSADSQKLKK